MANDEVGPPLTVAPQVAVPDIAGAAMGATQTLRVAYRGDAVDLFLLMIKNIFFTLVTFGIYAPWARAARRRFLWGQVEIDGQRLEFTGTGRELFFGYLKVLIGYIVLVVVPQMVRRQNPEVGRMLQTFSSLGIAILIPYAIYWSRRYLLSRTRWRGIRFGLAGDAAKFFRVWMAGSFLSVVTLGLYLPVFGNRVYATIMNNTRYGTGSFAYDGPNGQAFKIGLKGWILSLLTLGIYYFWYRAELQRFRLAHTRFDRAVGKMDISGGLFLKLALVNVFANLLSLGIAIPWTMTYTLRVVLERLSFSGPVDFAQIMQRPAAGGDGTGDALGGALGVELGI
jgi:uncharacterized membrane protein YjgN (DUF898 family)